jgi:hypothetical protein
MKNKILVISLLIYSIFGFGYYLFIIIMGLKTNLICLIMFIIEVILIYKVYKIPNREEKEIYDTTITIKF